MNRLTNIKSGKSVVLTAIEGGSQAKMRLVEMGFLPGVIISVVNNPGIGPLTINIKGSKLALGYGLAKKLLVQES
jgi:ferrous iron transport protein A